MIKKKKETNLNFLDKLSNFISNAFSQKTKKGSFEDELNLNFEEIVKNKK